jgi:hypothetical protein
MAISSNGYKFADEKSITVSLREMVGGYELVFAVTGTTDPQKETAHWLVVHSGRVSVRSNLGQRELGTALPGMPTTIRQYSNPGYFSLELKLPVQPSQLAALEDHRNGGNLDFDITIAGIGGAKHPSDAPEYPILRMQVAQSAWIAQLASANAKNILLLEVAMPIAGAAPKRKAIFGHIQHAQKLFVDGLYSECVGECRKAIEEMEEGTASTLWASLASRQDREAMEKTDRLRAIFGTVHLYTHLAAHSASRGGISNYTRADAKLLLVLVATFVCHEASQ